MIARRGRGASDGRAEEHPLHRHRSVAGRRAWLCRQPRAEGQYRRQHQRHHELRLQERDGLAAQELDVLGRGETPIVPVLVGEEETAQSISRALFEAGFFAAESLPEDMPPGHRRLILEIADKYHSEKE